MKFMFKKDYKKNIEKLWKWSWRDDVLFKLTLLYEF
jgi:hypothetical protein